MISSGLIEKIEASVFDRDDTSVLRDIADHYDLSHVAFVGLHLPQTGRETRPFSYLTYPKEWQERYLSQGYLTFDPAIHRAMDSIVPLDWTTIDKKESKVRALFGEAREFGIGQTGITFPIRGCRGELALLTVSGSFNDSDWRDFKRENLADLQILSFYVYNMIERNGAIEIHAPPKLSNREVECLKWASCGKTFEDISVILNLSPRTVKFYMDTARHKLNCLSITHAVARAVSLRIIPPVF
jgi:DNA-binding CsgD family transcriptional regulator